MSVKFVRPGDSDFGEAYRNCKPVIPIETLDTKTIRTYYNNRNFVHEVCLASSVQGSSVVVAIKKSDFEYYFRKNLAQLTWEKSYSMTPTRGPVDGPVMTPNEAKKIKIDSNHPEFNKLLATAKLPSYWMESEVVNEYDHYSDGIEPYLNSKPVSGGNISKGTISAETLTTGYGTDTKHFSEIYNALIKQNEAEQQKPTYSEYRDAQGNVRVKVGLWSGEKTEHWRIPVSKEIEDYCNAYVKFTREYYITEEKKDMNNVVDNKLYLVIGEGPHKGKYVTKIAINKANEFVVEAKGENAYFSVKEADLERVLPYSVDVRFMASNGAALNGRVYSYWSNPGDVAVGDVIFAAEYGNPMIVVAVDTKAESATKFLTGSVMKPAKVLEGK